MSTLKEAEAYIAETKRVVLATVTSEGEPTLRTLGGFASDGLTVYLSTSKTSGKVEQLQHNPHASLLFQHEGQEVPQFRNVTLTGTVSKVCSKCGAEYDKAIGLLSAKSSRFKERVEKGDLENNVILKLEPRKVKLLDLSKGLAGEEVVLQPSGTSL